jgi:pyruvate dehydrogenase E2 component (dihydrolipoamide acetyltransferase)
MAVELIMPKLSMTMEEGHIVSWLKDEGEEVEEGEVILEVLSDKTNFEVEAPAEGVLLKKIYQEDDVVPVTEVIGYIGEEGENIDELLEESEEAEEAKAPEIEEDKIEEEISAEESSEIEETEEKEETSIKEELPGGDKVRTVPAVRRIAAENNIDLKEVTPTGEGNVIELKDIEAYLEAQSQVKAVSAHREKLSGLRKASARKVKESWTEIPHVTITSEVNMEEILKLKDQWNQLQTDKSMRVSLTDLLIKITAVAMEKHKTMNAYLEEDEVVYNDGINIGLAVSMGETLTVPVLKNLENKKIKDIVVEKAELIEKAKDNKLKKENLTGGSLTISNLGMYGTEIFTPILNAPESGILGVGTVKKKPVVVNDEIKAQRMMWLSLSFDHRLVEGAAAAEFLREIKDLLEFPAKVMF